MESDASYNKNAASRSNVSRKSHNSSLPNRTARASSGDSEDELASGSEAAGNAANEASRSDAELSFVVSDDSNDNDNDVSRCFSPRTRQSLGVGRLDLDTDSDTEDEDDDEIIENSISVSRAAVADSTGLEVPESDDDVDGDAAKSTNTTAISPLPQRKSSAFVALHNEESVADFENIHDGELAQIHPIRTIVNRICCCISVRCKVQHNARSSRHSSGCVVLGRGSVRHQFGFEQ